MDKEQKRILTQIILFIATFISTTLAGAEWTYGNLFLYVPHSLGWHEFVGGMTFSIPFLTILTAHEFGHYFTAKYYKIKVTLPYYIPAWFGFMALPSIGTMGALIRLRQRVKSLKQTFDVGIAGPLAGFVVAIFVIIYGFTHLPPAEYVYNIHPEYEHFGLDYDKIVYDKDTFMLRSDLAKYNVEAASRYEADTINIGPGYQVSLALGSNLIFEFAKAYIVPDAHKDRIPSRHEMMHYPWLFAGFLALLFTAINLLPIGQLDGGHVLYGLLGMQKSRKVAAVLFLALIVYSGLGVGLLGIYNPFDFTQSITDMILAVMVYGLFIYYLLGRMNLSRQNRVMLSLGVLSIQEVLTVLVPGITGYSGWMLFAFIIGRYIGVYHPPVEIEEPLNQNRKLLGWIALIIFIISFSPQPLDLAQ
jgi:membrane-associated protease RseP (regulator of RpoE activity)